VFDFPGCCLSARSHFLGTSTLSSALLTELATATGATAIDVGDRVQELWGGYGGIIRLHLKKDAHANSDVQASAILKLIKPPEKAQHPRGWNTNSSHQRKLLSYQIETQWYSQHAQRCNRYCPVPNVIATGVHDGAQWILMQDLAIQYPQRASSLSLEQAHVCLRWLAAFHAEFIQYKPDGLWPIGTYWHLDTRQDEYDAMVEGELKSAAHELDRRLNECPVQTLVHGDAKVANFCFSQNKQSVAAVDFQYVGGGVGIKDVAYFLGSCLAEEAIEKHEQALLSVYFDFLVERLSKTHSNEFALEVREKWSSLYAIAWTDFYRFLEGWMPGHAKINRYTKQLAEQAFAQITSRIPVSYPSRVR